MKIDVDARKELERLVREHGSQERAAAAIGLTQSKVSQLLKGRATFSESILQRLGLRRTIVSAR